MSFLATVEFGLLASEVALGFRHLHSFASPQPNEVGLEIANHGEDIEQESSDRIGGIVDRPTEIETYLANREFVGDRSCVREGPGQSIELGDHQRVALSTSSQGLTQARPFAIGAGESMVNVDPFGVTPSAARPSRWEVRSC